jgi:hypothetical protein
MIISTGRVNDRLSLQAGIMCSSDLGLGLLIPWQSVFPSFGTRNRESAGAAVLPVPWETVEPIWPTTKDPIQINQQCEGKNEK